MIGSSEMTARARWSEEEEEGRGSWREPDALEAPKVATQ